MLSDDLRHCSLHFECHYLIRGTLFPTLTNLASTLSLMADKYCWKSVKLNRALLVPWNSEIESWSKTNETHFRKFCSGCGNVQTGRKRRAHLGFHYRLPSTSWWSDFTLDFEQGPIALITRQCMRREIECGRKPFKAHQTIWLEKLLCPVTILWSTNRAYLRLDLWKVFPHLLLHSLICWYRAIRYWSSVIRVPASCSLKGWHWSCPLCFQLLILRSNFLGLIPSFFESHRSYSR